MTVLQIVALVVCGAVTLTAVALFVQAINRFVRTFSLGQPESRTDHPAARWVTLFREFLGHTRMARLPVVAVAHWFTMIAFGVLFFTLVNAFGQLVDPDWALPLIGAWPPYEWVTDIFGVGGFVAIVVLMVIRQLRHPRRSDGDGGRRSRFFGSTWWQAYYVELTILGVTFCIGLLRGLEYALAGRLGTGQDTWVHFPLTGWIGSLFSGLSEESLETWIVAVAAVKILISFAWMITISLTPTMGVAWHRFLAFVNIWAKRNADGRTSLGALQPIRVGGQPVDFEQIEDLDEDAALGVGKVEDFTWKGLLDFSTCTECGRCQSQCPAWNTDKPLSPKLLVMGLRDHAFAKAPWLLASEEERDSGEDISAETKAAVEVGSLVGSTGYAPDAPLDAYRPLGGGDGGAVIDEEVLWSCTTCGACVEQCPVDIEHVDEIVDMRRYQVLIESAFPAELNGLFKNLEKNANPWGMAPRMRLDWAKDLPFDVPVVGADVESLSEVDYLFWVGCAGALEDRAKRTTRAVAELLHTAGVSFAVLGDGESCTGDPARRAGNEFLFQMLAQQNIEVLDAAGARKIVVTCAHCFNTLRNEYPQVGGQYEVVHHTQLLNRLVRDKRLIPVSRPGDASSLGAASTAPTVTYHDPCYLGRHNGVYAPPRELLGSLPGVELREMPRTGQGLGLAFCRLATEAHGGRIFIEGTENTEAGTTFCVRLPV